MAVHVMRTCMDLNFDPPSTSLNPDAARTARTMVVPPELTDEDLAWLNARSHGVPVERETAKVGKPPVDGIWMTSTQIHG